MLKKTVSLVLMLCFVSNGLYGTRFSEWDDSRNKRRKKQSTRSHPKKNRLSKDSSCGQTIKAIAMLAGITVGITCIYMQFYALTNEIN